VKLTDQVKVRTLFLIKLAVPIILVIIFLFAYIFMQKLKNSKQVTNLSLNEAQMISPTLTPGLTLAITPTPTFKLIPTLTPRPKITPKVTSIPVTSTPTQNQSQVQTTNPTSTQPPTATSVPQADGNMIDVYVTYYGWADNDPPGKAIAYPKSSYPSSKHEEAGGSGSFDDPITFASDPRVFPVGTKIYVPYIKKYVIMEDLCASCSGNHIDIWMESNNSFSSQLLACEDYWTKSKTQVEINPPNNRSFDSSLFFNKNNGECQHN
jgi:3D (Asp-Asp-Asp) domain-containing protein